MRSGKGVSSMNGKKRVKKTCLWLALLASRNPDVSNLGLDVYFMAPPLGSALISFQHKSLDKKEE